MEASVKTGTAEIVRRAAAAGVVVPALNIPHLPMVAPIVQALRDANAFGLIQVARLEWEKFGARSLRAVRDEYARVKDERFTRLHLDHVPVIDEDGRRVDWEPILREAIELGYESLMLDGSRLPLAENIAATRRAAGLAHAAGLPLEAELGAVLGHEAGPLPPYEELFQSRKGFTDPEEAERFVAETAADWLSVAIGNIHGAIAGAARGQKKVEARLDVAHLDRIRERSRVPLVLHGGSGIRTECLRDAFRHGIAKINVGTTLRQAYEARVGQSVPEAQAAVYKAARDVLERELGVAGSAALLAH
jgi:ketose-bisphosphate aldolase